MFATSATSVPSVTSSRSLSAAAVIVPVLLGLASGAVADVNNLARGFVNPAFPTGPLQEQIVEHPGLCVASASDVAGFATIGHGDGRADYGYIVANASVQGSASCVGAGVVRDELVFSVPGLAVGTAIQVTFSVTASGTFDTSTIGTTGAVWIVGANMNGDAYEINPFGGEYNNVPSGASLGTYTGTATVGVGLVTPLQLEVNVTATAGYSDAQVASAELNDITLAWGGISAVKRNGVPVASWSVSSASGTNWSGSISPPPPACPADLGGAGGLPGGDGSLDNNDFIVFIGWFFAQDARADLGSAGGVSGPDGAFDNNDFIAFIGLFFAGC